MVEIRRFFSDLETSKFLFVYDHDDLPAFIGGHCLLRAMMAKPTYEDLFIRDAQTILAHAALHPGLRIVLYDVMITLDELLLLSLHCSQLLVFSTKHTLWHELNYRPQARKVPGHVKIIVESSTTCPKLVYSCLHMDHASFPDYITACEYEFMPETIQTPQQQLLMRMARDHQEWWDRYPVEPDIGQDAEELGYRFIDSTDRLARIIKHNAMVVGHGKRRLLYINCSTEDMPGVARLLLNTHKSLDELDYFILYDIKDSWVHYEVTRRTKSVDLVAEFRSITVHGKANRVVHRRPLSRVFRGFTIHHKRWFPWG